MFELLKKKFSKFVESLKVKKEEIEKKRREAEIEKLLEEFIEGLIEADVSYKVALKLKAELKEKLVEQVEIKPFLKNQLLSILSVEKLDLLEFIRERKKEKSYITLIFFGVNGVGKTLTLAKVANFLKQNGFKVVLAAGDTFRAASIEQLEAYGEKIGVKVVKQKYGADPAAVIFDARKFAEANRFDVVLADTSGRIHTQKDLMEELKKIVRVNKPDLKILVLDSLTGNDVLMQVKFFEEVGIDALIFTKLDVNPKGGNLFSVCYEFKKPILFLGNGQGIEDLEYFKPEKIVDALLSITS